MILTLEQKNSWAATQGEYYRKVSANYHHYMTEFLPWPDKPKYPYKRTRSQAQSERQQRIRNERWMKLNPNNTK